MSKILKLCSVSDVPPGSMQTVKAGGHAYLVANIDGEFFVLDDTCTHEQCSLGTEGFLDGYTVNCGCHGAMFNVRDGKVLALPAPRDLSSYEVHVTDGNVLVTA